MRGLRLGSTGRTPRSTHGAAIGWVPERYPRVGAVFIIRRHEIDYQRSALGGDEIRIVTWVEEFRRASATRETRIYRTRDNALLVSATTEWVFVTYDNNYRPTRIPAEVADDFRGGAKGSVFQIDPAVPTGTPVMMAEGIPGAPGET